MTVGYFGAGIVVVLALNITAIPDAFYVDCKICFHTGCCARWVCWCGCLRAAIRFGVARGVFSNEAGLGSAPIAHARQPKHKTRSVKA